MMGAKGCTAMRLRSIGMAGGKSIALPAALMALAACGGGGGSAAPAPSPTPNPTPTVVQPTAADASRLLEQATFGVTASDVSHVQNVGINAYLGEQLTAAATQYSGFNYTPHTAPADCQNHPATPTDASSICARDNYSPFQVQRQFFTH